MTSAAGNTVSAFLASAAAILRSAGVEDPRREAASLMTFDLNRESVFLIAHPEYELNADESVKFNEAVSRRANREPFHYIVGSKEFYGLEFDVAPGVLIPRPETELLVEEAIGILRDAPEPRFLEIGVGSGCISISMLHNVVSSTAVGVDISSTALSIASANAKSHAVDKRIDLLEGSVYAGIQDKFDLIVSNPPYIPDNDLLSLQAEVGAFEPHSALFGGADGLVIVRQIISEAPAFLQERGHILIEIGSGQSAAVKGLFDTSIWRDIEFIKDLQNIDRIAKARLRH